MGTWGGEVGLEKTYIAKNKKKKNKKKKKCFLDFYIAFLMKNHKKVDNVHKKVFQPIFSWRITHKLVKNSKTTCNFYGKYISAIKYIDLINHSHLAN